MKDIDNKLDEILDIVYAAGCQSAEGYKTHVKERYTDARLAIKLVITEATEKAVADYQTEYEQKHIADAIRIARIDELKNFIVLNKSMYGESALVARVANNRIAELEGKE